MTGWVVAFVILVLGIFAVAVGAIVWTGNNTYYVGFEGQNVAIYQGKPGGVLWIEPELVKTTKITKSDLPQDVRLAVADNNQFDSKAAATRYIVTLQAIVDKQEAATTTTTTTSSTTSTTSTTAVPTTTTPPTTTTSRP